MRIAWLTDIHLDHLWPRDVRDVDVVDTPPRIVDFCDNVENQNFDAIVISGDISIAGHRFIDNFFATTEYCLKYLSERFNKPIYFVLGNHDYYFGSINETRAKMVQLSNKSNGLTWLTNGYIVNLSSEIGLVGHDGWYDLRNGTLTHQYVMSEFEYVSEFSGYRWDWNIAKKKCQELADDAAEYFLEVIPEALKIYNKLIVVTHVPPFVEASKYRGKPTDEDHLPFYSCKAVGDALLKVAKDHPTKEIVTLSGHTHGFADYSPLPNLRSLVCSSWYGSPSLQKIIDLADNQIKIIDVK